MSEYGLITNNLTGRVVIDSMYKNFSYKTGGSLACSSGLNNLNITDTALTILCAIRPTTSGYSNVISYVKSGSNFTDIKIGSSASQTIPWILFIEGYTADPDSGYGLNVYNEDGDVVFTSNETGYLKLVGIHSGGNNLSWTQSWDVSACSSGPTLTISSYNITVNDADNNYFILLGKQSAVAYCYSNTTRWFYHAGIKKVNSTTIEVGLFQYTTDTTNLGFNVASINGYSAQPGYILEVEKPPSL